MVGKADEKRLREILATFINQKPEEITYETPIDRSTFSSSILIHRMFADLEKANFSFDNRNEIKNFGDLVGVSNPSKVVKKDRVKMQAIGIDILDIENMPIVNDFRTDSFYKQNFTDYEISYSLRQNNPYRSFAGRFAAKEAIIKADNNLIGKNFSDIEILANDSGKPMFENFILSVSYTDDKAVAVALRKNMDSSNDDLFIEEKIRKLKFWNKVLVLIVGINLIISLLLAI